MQSRLTNVHKEDDFIYCNLVLTNNNSTSLECSTIQSLPADLLPTGINYDVAVDRWATDGSSLPIFIFPDNYFTLTLTYETYTSEPVYLTYSSISDKGPNNLIPNGVFSYQEFALIVNQAFILAYSQLNDATGGVLTSSPPYMLFDTITQKYKIYADSTFYDETISEPCSIFFNSNLYYMFNNFLIEFISENNTVIVGEDYRIAVRNLLGTNTYTYSGTTYLVMEQEYQNCQTMQAVQTVSLFSNTLAIKPEYTTLANPTTSLINTNYSGGGIPFASLVTDFIGSFSDAAQWRSKLLYIPTYRRYHGRSIGANTNKIDISVKWTDEQNNTYPLYIEPGKNFTIKFVFQRRKN